MSDISASQVLDTEVANPYVGPRSIERGEGIYGRDAEGYELLDRVKSDRIVLLYAPSGAGKTSLLQAKLTPDLENEGFRVWNPLRVNLALPNGERAVEANRYRLSAMLSLEEQFPDERFEFEELLEMSFHDYLDRRLGTERLDVLFFDQFEEVLTLDPLDTEVKTAFLEDVGLSLTKRDRWAVFAIREANLAQIDPYRVFLPTRLRSGFRLDLLKESEATKAIRTPAELAHRPFAPRAAEDLVRDLRRTRQPGTDEETYGPYVEPVHLQVACARIWEETEGRREITRGDVSGFGSIDDALREYFDSAVAKAAAGDRDVERAVRDWINTELISEGIRRQEQKGPSDCPPRVVEELIDAHLIRSETRRGTPWYELSHDRMIEPALESNRRWYEANLWEVPRRARAWQESNRMDNALLLSRSELSVAEAYAKPPEGSLEFDYLRESRRRLRRIRNRRWLFIGSLATVFVLAVAAVLLFRFWRDAEDAKGTAETARIEAEAATEEAELRRQEAEAARVDAEAATREAELRRQEAEAAKVEAEAATQEAEDARAVAETRRLLASAGRVVGTDPNLAMHLALASVAKAPTADAGLEARAALYEAVSATRVVAVFGSEPAAALALDPDGGTLLAGYADGEVLAWDVATGEQLTWARSGEEVVDAAWAGSVAATVDAAGTVTIWDAEAAAPVVAIPIGGSGPYSLALGDGGDTVAVSTGGGQVMAWDAASGEQLVRIVDPARARTAVAVEPGGAALATSRPDGTVARWSLVSGNSIGSFALPESGSAAAADTSIAAPALAVSPSGGLIAAGTADGRVRVWNAGSAAEVVELTGHAQAITDLGFSADGSVLACASTDGTVHVWTVDGTEVTESLVITSRAGAAVGLSPFPGGRRLVVATELGSPAIVDVNPGHRRLVRALAHQPGGNLIVTASLDETAWLWDLDGRFAAELDGHDGGLWDVAFSNDGRFIATASSDRTVKVWEVATGQVARTISGHGDAVYGVRFSPDGDRLATASGDGLVRLWDLTGPGNLTDGDELLVLEGHSAAVNVVAFSDDGELIATGSDDGSAIVWDRAGVAVATFAAEAGEAVNQSIITLAFSPDGRRLATGGFDERVRVWDVAAGEVRLIADPFFGVVYEVVWSSDGSGLIVATDDPATAVQVFDMTENALLVAKIPYTGPIYALSYVGEDRIAMAGGDGRLVLNPLEEADLTSVAESRIARPLSAEECRRYSITELCSSQGTR